MDYTIDLKDGKSYEAKGEKLMPFSENSHR